MAKSKKFSLAVIIAAAVALVGMILVVAGVFSKFVTYKATSVLGNSTNSFSLSELNEHADAFEKLGAMTAFAWIVFALSIGAVVMAVLTKLMAGKAKLFTLITLIVAACALVATIVLMIVTGSFCSSNANISWGSLGNGKYVFGAGAILMAIGGLFSACGSAACVKLK